MAATDVELCNMALNYLGITQAVVNSIIAPTTKEERIMARFYPVVRKRLLTGHPWDFARRRAVLAQQTTNITLDGWTYAYVLPANFLKPRQLYINGYNESVDAREQFEIVSLDDGSGTVLACNVAPVATLAPILIYTIDIPSTTPTIFTPNFDLAMATALAAEVAQPLRAEVTALKTAKQLALEAWMTATADNRERRQDPQPPEAEHIRARS